jgi:hypothetical protein
VTEDERETWELDEDSTRELPERIVHPYPRYGLAAATWRRRDVTEEELPEVLADAIEDSLEFFQMETQDVPAASENLRYRSIKRADLETHPEWVQGKLSEVGKYLFPSVVTIDGDAKGTFENALEVIKSLRAGARLDSPFEFKRSFAPTVSKINNGGSQKNPRGTLLEAACSVLATLTPNKPAAWVETRNTAIIPDLPLDELREFILVFTSMQRTKTNQLMTAALPKKDGVPQATARTKRGTVKPQKTPAVPKSEYRRPPLHGGNYPGSPREAAAFGAAGLLGAIGQWALSAEEEEREAALRVLDSFAKGPPSAKGYSGRPLYIVNYDGVTQAQFSHHVVGLAKRGTLADLIDTFHRDARLYTAIEEDRPRRDPPGYKLLYLMTSRFLQQFDRPAFRDFLAIRAEYPATTQPLFGEYFMNAQNTPKETVESARALGQWLNRTAYFVAESETDPKDRAAREALKLPQNKAKRAEFYKAVQKAKAKILVEFESAVMSAKTPTDMLHRISTRAGRLLQWDAPPEATNFYDATASATIPFETAQHLLIAYMRLRSPITKAQEPDPYAVGTDGSGESNTDTAVVTQQTQDNTPSQAAA